MSEKKVIGVRVSKALIDEIIKLLNLNPEMPATYVVDQALRDFIENIKKGTK